MTEAQHQVVAAVMLDYVVAPVRIVLLSLAMLGAGAADQQSPESPRTATGFVLPEVDELVRAPMSPDVTRPVNGLPSRAYGGRTRDRAHHPREASRGARLAAAFPDPGAALLGCAAARRGRLFDDDRRRSFRVDA